MYGGMNNPMKWTKQTRSISKTDIKRDLYVFFQNDLKEPREVQLLGKATFMGPAPYFLWGKNKWVM